MARSLKHGFMANVLLSAFLVLLAYAAQAQGRTKTLNTDSGVVILHYYTTGELSAKEWMDKDDRWGRSWAWAKDGRELINHQTRKIGGHASVSFSYHANGGISKAEVSDAPDGGIQWYRSTTTFDEHGERTGFTEQGHGNDGPIPGIDVRVQQAPKVTVPPEQEQVKEQRMFVNEVFVTNGSSWSVEITVTPEESSPALTGSRFILKPNETVSIGTYSQGETFVSPVERMKVIGTVTNKRGKKRIIGVLMMEKRQVSPEHRAWFYHVMPSGGRVGFSF